MKALQQFLCKMRLQVALLFLVYTEGKKKVKDDEVLPGVDVMPAPFPVPVPFGHIFKDGVGDPSPEIKQPIDPLELHLRTPLRHEQDKYIKSVPKSHLLRIVDNEMPPKNTYRRFSTPSDEDDEAKEEGAATTEKADDRPKWFHFEALLERNLKTPRPAIALHAQPSLNLTEIKARNVSDIDSGNISRSGHFSEHSYGLYKDPETKVVFDQWTTCEQFEKKTRTFLPKDIVDIDWVPFYAWTTAPHIRSVVHRFSFPTKKDVKYYKDAYGPYLSMPVDWEAPKLLLKEGMEILLIAADRNGLFHGIPKMKLPYNMELSRSVKIPVITMRLRVEDPYLALMFCNEYYAIIMAAPGTEPATDEEKTEEAAVLKFKGIGMPISRDFELEEIYKRSEMQKQKDSEETRYIKIWHTGFDIDRE